MVFDHWVRRVMNDSCAQIVSAQGPRNLDVMEISGDGWSDFGQIIPEPGLAAIGHLRDQTQAAVRPHYRGAGF